MVINLGETITLRLSNNGGSTPTRFVNHFYFYFGNEKWFCKGSAKQQAEPGFGFLGSVSLARLYK